MQWHEVLYTMNMRDLELRSMIKFLTKEGKKPKEIHERMNASSEKMNILNVIVPCYSFLDCIVIGKWSPMEKFFKVSEEKVTGSQVWTVGQMVKLYEATFPYSSLRCV